MSVHDSLSLSPSPLPFAQRRGVKKGKYPTLTAPAAAAAAVCQELSGMNAAGRPERERHRVNRAEAPSVTCQNSSTLKLNAAGFSKANWEKIALGMAKAN